ncbi:hypothetical protein ACFVMC_25655 [Nocardia sp. NPDC127579]
MEPMSPPPPQPEKSKVGLIVGIVLGIAALLFVIPLLVGALLLLLE